MCILQAGTAPNGSDDQGAAKDDWDKESQHLWETFRAAYITICAASSTSCRDSFLQDRPVQPGIQVKLRTADSSEDPTSSTSSCAAYKIIPWPTKTLTGDYTLTHNTPFHSIIMDSHWYSRGWVHQEISFSRRLLVFGTNMLCMRFGELEACENGWQRRNYYQSLQSSPLPKIDTAFLRHSPFEQFASDVEKFHNKQITVETDRLPAIAGLANQVASLTKSQYLAGLWRDNLANDLLFSITPTREDIKFDERIRELSAPLSQARPSWSWVGHGISLKNRLGRNFESSLRTSSDWALDCVILDAVAEPDGKNPFGAVKIAHLSLRCRVLALEELLLIEPSTILENGYETNFKELSIFWDTNNENTPVKFVANVLFICTSEHSVMWLDDRKAVAGLIIYPAGDGGYYRIGMWQECPYEGIVSPCVDNHREWESRTIKMW